MLFLQRRLYPLATEIVRGDKNERADIEVGRRRRIKTMKLNAFYWHIFKLLSSSIRPNKRVQMKNTAKLYSIFNSKPCPFLY